ncbi:MAG: thioredoxin family protein [Spirochaetota bacterium]
MRFLKVLIRTILLLSLVSIPGMLIAGDVTWYSFNEGFKIASQKKKPVIIDFYADWCMWCKVMEDKTFSDPGVQKKLVRDYVAIRIDMQKNESIVYDGKTYAPQQFSGMLGVEGLPTIVFMDKNGKFVTRIPGFVKADIFNVLLNYMKEECYTKQVTFKDYMKDKDCKK